MTWQLPDRSITCRMERIGRDWLITLTGGEKDSDRHIGAVSIAYPDAARSEGIASTVVVPGHKEHLLSEPMALEALRCLPNKGGHVTVACGIHFDHLDAEQIQVVVNKAWHVFRSELQHIME